MHDYARELTEEELLELTAKHNLSTDGVELMQTSLLHGPVGAWLLEEEGLITDKQVLDAIRWHTTGHAQMTALEKIVYLADMVEPSRKPYPGLEPLRKLCFTDLDDAMRFALDSSLDHVQAQGKTLHPDTLAALADYEHK